LQNSGDCSDSILPVTAVSECAISFHRSEYDGFYLKLANTAYTGFLEAQDQNGVTQKSFRVQDGVVLIKLTDLTEALDDGFRLRFRIWTPDELFPGEKRIPEDQPWSNWTRVTISP